MRSSLWPGLIKAAHYNLKRQQTRVRLFEAGLRFVDNGGLRQTPTLAAIAIGEALPEQWGMPSRQIDFYDLKGDVEAVLALGAASDQLEFRPEPHHALHPGQCSRLVSAQRPIGWLGALHPALQQALGIKQKLFVFELELEALEKPREVCFREISKFPAIRRDLAIVVEEPVTAAQVVECIVQAGGDRVRDLYVFDVYRGEGVPEGRKSFALGLILQDLTRTLKDEEVDATLSQVVRKLTQTLGASLRM
jgi:phenylalanyl-tRNA synthetase beta chain